MRISDLSSGVCSSDLALAQRGGVFVRAFPPSWRWAALPSGRGPASRKPPFAPAQDRLLHLALRPFGCGPPPGRARQVADRRPPPRRGKPWALGGAWRHPMDDTPNRRARHERREDAPRAARASLYDEVTNRIIGRSEENTSELQSLMRIPYAVFCLKKKR